MRRLILPILAGLAMVLVNAQGTKADLLSAEVTQVWTFPRIELAERSPKTAKVYSGSGGYNVAGRIEGDKVYSGSSGFNVVGRIEGNKIYSGSSGYNVAGRVDGKKVGKGTRSTRATPATTSSFGARAAPWRSCCSRPWCSRNPGKPPARA
ncbi:MAG: hypothetical protein RJA22_1785 [Verrucomicrobiota bacterium]